MERRELVQVLGGMIVVPMLAGYGVDELLALAERLHAHVAAQPRPLEFFALISALPSPQ